MTLEERFVFDLQGCLVIKGVRSPAEVAEMNAVADEQSTPKPGEDTSNRRNFGIVHWGEPCKRLIDHPNIVPYLIELLGPKLGRAHVREPAPVHSEPALGRRTPDVVAVG